MRLYRTPPRNIFAARAPRLYCHGYRVITLCCLLLACAQRVNYRAAARARGAAWRASLIILLALFLSSLPSVRHLVIVDELSHRLARHHRAVAGGINVTAYGSSIISSGVTA